MEFEQELIDRTKAYFLGQFQLEIGDETADEYLGQFAELYGSMAVFAACKGRLATSAHAIALSDAGAGAAAPDLILPHSC
jgi:hypothetical protein